MKKIKHKKKIDRGHCPAFVVGYVGESPPAGFLSAWYNQVYGGPLHIRFSNAQSNTLIEAVHLDWKADVRLESPGDVVSQWQTQIGWEHTGVAQVVPASRIGVSRIDAALFVARLGRGLTLLTGGTAYDLFSELYRNPSDWSDRPLIQFCLADHIHVHKEESLTDGRQRFVTKGMSKFGLEELEIFRPRGLSEQPTTQGLLELAQVCLDQGKSPKVGDRIFLPDERAARIVRHRTVSTFRGQVNVREFCWD